MTNDRRQRRDLTIDEVVERALEIAQHEGERGLTMRAVADACGVTPMALYHHVENKESLLTAIVDRVVADALADLDPAGPWRTELVDFLCRWRAGLLAHPTAAQVYVRRPVLSPTLARCTEALFETFARGGLDGGQIAAATDAVVLLTMGSVANDLTRPAEVRDALTQQLPSNSTPLLVDNIDDYSRRDPEVRFRSAVDWLLDGMLASESSVTRTTGRAAPG